MASTIASSDIALGKATRGKVTTTGRWRLRLYPDDATDVGEETWNDGLVLYHND